jgi:hypothetical protein
MFPKQLKYHVCHHIKNKNEAKAGKKVMTDRRATTIILRSNTQGHRNPWQLEWSNILQQKVLQAFSDNSDTYHGFL